MGRVNGDLGFGGLVLSAGSESINILLRALSETRRVEVLSRPMVQALHNQTGLIHVGQTFQQINGVIQPTTVGGVTQPNLEERAVGIQLTVTPRVSPDGTIVMEVVATKDQISPNNVVPVFFDPQTGTTFDSPVIDTATAQASVSVRDGQTIVLGGMITRTEGTVERKVPWLADLPVLGAVFRYDSHTVRRTELLIFLTPRIMKTPADYEEQKQVEAERMSFSVEDAEEIHGPLFSMPEPATEDIKKSKATREKTKTKLKPMPQSKDPQPARKPGEKPGEKPAEKPGEKEVPRPPGGDSGQAAGLSDDRRVSPASMTTIDEADHDARIFALPETIDGFEASVPIELPKPSPIKRFFNSLLP